MNWKSAVHAIFPNASTLYKQAIDLRSFEDQLEAAGILDNALRASAFFATVGIESGGMRLTRENMNYRAKQIEKVFGVGRHSAAITKAESKTLAGKPQPLAERVYGIGNPTKAREFGNTASGDGFHYRGIGPFQNTGKNAILRLMKKVGVNSIADLLLPEFLFRGAILFWIENNMNELADIGNTRRIRKVVNGGYNGYDEFLKQYEALAADLGVSAMDAADEDHETVMLQTHLNKLGYKLKVDGKYGKETEAAVRHFQKANGLFVDGIAGDATDAIIETRLHAKTPVEPPKVQAISDESKAVAGGAGLGLGAAAEAVIAMAREVGGMPLDSPILRVIPPVLMVIGVVLMLWPIMRGRK